MASQFAVSMYFLAFFACPVLVVGQEKEVLMRSDGGRRSVTIDPHSHMQHSHVQVEDFEQPTTGGEQPASMTQQELKEDPCSSLGCNSHKCEWASGGRIQRLVAKKACSNAVLVGSQDGAISMAPAATASSMLAKDAPADADAADATATAATAVAAGAQAQASTATMAKVVTLRDCMNAVRSKSGSTCSGHFQLHKDTMACMCVPAGETCAETEDENTCRYQVVEPK